MSTRTTTIVVLIMIAAATLAGLLLWNRLPDQMASHWNINDQVDGYMPKFWGVFLLPLITLGLLGLFLAVPALDPLKANIAQFREAFNLFIVLMAAFMLYIYGLSLAWSLGYTGFRMSGAMLPAIGLLFIFIGFMMRKAKRNFFIGIRTPWTLSSDAVWERTHRVGGVVMLLIGTLLIAAGALGTAKWFYVAIGGAAVLVMVVLVYSYLAWKAEQRA